MQITHIIVDVDKERDPLPIPREKIISCTVDGSNEVWITGIPKGTASGATVVGIVSRLPDSDEAVFIEVKLAVLHAACTAMMERHGK